MSDGGIIERWNAKTELKETGQRLLIIHK